MSEAREEPRCAAMAPLLHALADGELDAANTLRCEAHLSCCGHCAALFSQIGTTRAALRREGVRHHAPEALRAQVLAAVDATAPAVAAEGGRHRLLSPLALATLMRSAAAGAARRWGRRGGLPALALAAGLAALIVAVVPRTYAPEDDPAAALRREVVAGHVRSLLVANHLTDVPSSSQHTVKPWFAGRLDFSPPVPDLADAGFPLAGGRMDYLDGRPVAALVYRRRDHVINVFVWPDQAAAQPAPPRRAEGAPGQDGGHAVVHWSEGGMRFWAVSDLNAAELTDFARMFGTRSAPPPPG